MCRSTAIPAQFGVQYFFSTIGEISKTLFSQNKASQRLALAGGVGSGERGI